MLPLPRLSPTDRPNARHFNLLVEAIESLRPIGASHTTRGVLHDYTQTTPRWTGDVWVYGVLYTGNNAYPENKWIRVDKNVNPPAITEEAGPPPSPWGQGVEWRRKVDQTTIYL